MNDAVTGEVDFHFPVLRSSPADASLRRPLYPSGSNLPVMPRRSPPILGRRTKSAVF